MPKKRWLSFFLSIIFIFSQYGEAQAAPSSEVAEAASLNLATPSSWVTADEMKWWQDAKFGMFISCSPACLTGREMGWSREGSSWPKSSTIPAEIYDQLFHHYNPSLFNAKEWVQCIKDSGAKYVIFVTEHSDGFAFWDTQYSENKITNPQSPFRRDLMRELKDELTSQSIPIVWYYSIEDWSNPYLKTPEYPKHNEQRMNQLRELLTDYGPVAGLWLDHMAMTAPFDSKALFDMAAQLQPGLVIMGRDYDCKEQRVGVFNRQRTWEDVMTLGNQWSWCPNEPHKSPKTCIQTLVQCAGNNGNLALNTGPMPDGRIEPRQVDRFREIGNWLKQYGDSIYGTRGGPFKPNAHAVSTCKDNKIYVHVLDWEGKETIDLGSIPNKVISHGLLTGGLADVWQSSEGIRIYIPQAYHQNIDTIMVLEVDGSAADIEPVAGICESAAFQKSITASDVYSDNPKEYGPAYLVDGDPATRWISKEAVCWVEIDMGQPCEFDRAVMYEWHDRVLEFELQVFEGSGWRTFHRGTTIGDKQVIDFAPVTGQRVRLQITKAHAAVHIGEIRLLNESTSVN